MGAGFSRTPLLVGDRLVVKDEGYKKRLMCFDAKTGKMIWTYPWKSNNCAALRHLRLTAADGAPVDMIILPEHHKIVRLSDGKELGEFRAEKNAPHYHILAWDDTDTIVVGGRSTSGPTEPSACHRIKIFVGCYKGTPSCFGTDLAGVVPHGDKLLIQSTAFLYCMGLRQGSGPQVG